MWRGVRVGDARPAAGFASDRVFGRLVSSSGHTTTKQRNELPPPHNVKLISVLSCRSRMLEGSSTVGLRHSVPRQLYSLIAVAIAATPKIPAMCQFLV